MKKFFKFGCGSIIALFVLLLVIGALIGDDTQIFSTEKEPVSTTTQDGSKEPVTEENKKIGMEKKLL